MRAGYCLASAHGPDAGSPRDLRGAVGATHLFDEAHRSRTRKSGWPLALHHRQGTLGLKCKNTIISRAAVAAVAAPK